MIAFIVPAMYIDLIIYLFGACAVRARNFVKFLIFLIVVSRNYFFGRCAAREKTNIYLIGACAGRARNYEII